MFDNVKFLVVGAGLSGAVIAERIANVLHEPVIVIDKRVHIGGLCYSEPDLETGIEIHRYGSHIFHTSDREVWEYVCAFADFDCCRHRVLTQYQGETFDMPINLATINKFFGLHLTPTKARTFIQRETLSAQHKQDGSFAAAMVNMVGEKLYEALICGYGMKQWGPFYASLPAGVAARIPIRYSYQSHYFDDYWEGIPSKGYGHLFRRMLASERIRVQTATDYFEIRQHLPERCHVIYTGPIDQLLDYQYGELSWRSLQFQFKRVDCPDCQGTAVMSYADLDVPYTRIHEFKHLAPRNNPCDATVICHEFPQDWHRGREPIYPVNQRDDKKILSQYLANLPSNMLVAGRMGTYTYMDMDDAIRAALNLFDSKIRFLR